MSEKVSLEALLPVAKDLYLQVVRPKIPMKDATHALPIETRLPQVADEFSEFTLQIYRKLSESK